MENRSIYPEIQEGINKLIELSAVFTRAKLSFSDILAECEDFMDYDHGAAAFEMTDNVDGCICAIFDAIKSLIEGDIENVKKVKYEKRKPRRTE